MKGNGIQPGDVHMDWPELMQFKRSFTEPVSSNREEGFARSGIVAFHGRAQFVGASTIQVGDDTLEGRYVVIAAGQKPADLKIAGTEHLTTSEQFLELDALPKRILFIGGGHIAFEFAHMRGRSRAQVTIAHSGRRPLPPSRPDFDYRTLKSRADVVG